MQKLAYIIPGKRNKDSATILIQLTERHWFGIFIPKYKDLMSLKMKALGSELSQTYIRGLLSKLPSTAKKITIDLPADKGPLSQYKEGILKTIFNFKKPGPIGITFVRGDKIPNFQGRNPKTEWMVIRRKNLLVESDTKQESYNPTCLFIKGNPKFWINGVSDKFYKQILSICKNAGYKILVSESDVHSSKLPDADVVIGFSRGTKYLKLPLNKWKYKIGIGAGKMPSDVYVLNNPDDKTMLGDHSKQSLTAHWTLTKEQANKLAFLLNKFKKRIEQERGEKQ